MKSLNEDCLILIFQFLPIPQRICIARVCKSWKKAIEISWCKVKTLDLSSSLWGFTRREIPAAVLRELLHKCGQYLTRINLNPYQDNFVNDENINSDLIVEFCPNLKDIDFSSLRLDRSQVRNIAEKYKNITKFILGDVSYPRRLACQFDEELNEIFKANSKLNYFEIMGNVCITKCLVLQVENMHTLKLKIFHINNLTICLEILEKLTNLRHLSLCGFSNAFGDIVKTVSAHCRNLTELKFYCCDYHFVDDFYILHDLIDLANLKVLTIHCCWFIRDNFLDDLVRHCVHLTYIDISGCNVVSNEGLAAIARLEKLEKLILNQLGWITFRNLSNMHHLKELYCQKCDSINNESMLMLTLSSPELQLLDISGCNKVNDVGLAAIVRLKKLEKLVLNNLNQIYFYNLPNMYLLKELYCQMCVLINDESISMLIKYSPELQSLDISGCRNVTDIGIAVIARFKKLKKLVLNDLYGITFHNVPEMHCLKELYCQECTLINDENMSTFIKSSSQLQFLDISGCKEITNITLQAAIDIYKYRSNKMTMIVKETRIKISEESIYKNLKKVVACYTSSMNSCK